MPDVPEDTPTMPVKKVGMIGAGTMGGGIAMNFANVGIPVTIVETKQEALDRGLARDPQELREHGQARPHEPERCREAHGLLTGTLELEALADCDLVIEAVFENMAIKKEVFGKLDAIVKQGAILATNTSVLDINEIATATKRPEAVIGMHFFSPANVMRLLEVVRGAKTSKPVIATVDGAREEDRQDRRAGRRVPRLRRQSHAGGAPVASAGNAPRRRDALGHRQGAVRIRAADGTVRDVRPRRPGHRLGQRDIEAARRCAKSSARWIAAARRPAPAIYDYDEKRTAKPSPVTEKIIKDFMAKKGATARKISEQEILERCVYPMINEGAKILARRHRDPRLRHRHRLDQRLRLAGVSRRADVLRATPSDWTSRRREAQGVRREARAHVQPVAAAGALAAEGKRFQD